MKKIDLIRHLKKNGCLLHRQGGNHEMYINQKNKKQVSIPRHNEIKKFLAKKICKQLEIPCCYH